MVRKTYGLESFTHATTHTHTLKLTYLLYSSFRSLTVTITLFGLLAPLYVFIDLDPRFSSKSLGPYTWVSWVYFFVRGASRA